MKRALAALILALVALLATSSFGMAQTTPQFRASFKALADMIPNIVGVPTENEFWDSTGNVVQHTTSGLMVWRASDRWTVFTNGSATWIMGPYGLQSRSNSDLYPWEVVPPGPTPAQAQQQPAPSTDQYNPFAPPPIPTAPPAPVPAAPTPVPAPPPPPPAATPTPVPGPAPTYVPDVKAMDDESGGHGVTIKAYMQQMDGMWLAVWGWRPHKPTTIYLYNDGYRMSYGISQVTGQVFNQWDIDNVAANNAASIGTDRTTGGYAIFMNLAYQYGTENWLDTLKANLLQQYGYVMIQDVSNNAGPDWFRIGIAQWMAYSNVTRTLAELGATHYAYQAKANGTLPSLYTLTNSWNETIRAGGESGQAAYGAAYLSVKYLAGNVGGMPLIQTLVRTSKGEPFESALQGATGYSIGRLEGEYRNYIPNE
jgi:hypothetical protein